MVTRGPGLAVSRLTQVLIFPRKAANRAQWLLNRCTEQALRRATETAWKLAPVPFAVNLRLLSHIAVALPSVKVSAYCVWRMKNHQAVRDLVGQLPPGSTVHLHCLDSEHNDPTSLAKLTRHRGPGPRIPLLQRLIAEYPPAPGHWVLVFDDDVAFPGGGLVRFLTLAGAAGLDLAQPAHLPRSLHTYPMTRARPLSLARLTRLVEVGPVVLMSPRIREDVLPFPADMKMGWGLDVEWSELVDRGYRLGVIDAAPMLHTGTVGTAYSQPDESAILIERLSRVGARSTHELARGTGGAWRPWQRRAPWLS